MVKITNVSDNMKRPAMPDLRMETFESWELIDMNPSEAADVMHHPNPSRWWRFTEWWRTRIFKLPHRDVPTFAYRIVDATGCWSTKPPPDDPKGWEPVEQFTWESDSDGFREVVSLIDNNLPPQVSMTNYYLLRFARGEEVNQWALYEEIDRCCQSRLIEIGKIDHLKRTCIDLYSREKQA